MDHIVPRWEWRTFGQDFGIAEQKLAALPPQKVQTSTEGYLLCVGSDANVKYRDNLLDIKQLERVNEDGLEQWLPVLKEQFPLAADAMVRLREALGVAPLPIHGEADSFDALVANLESASTQIRGVWVSKVRTRYLVHGCVAELTDVIANGKKVRTTAIEDEDPHKVITAVRAMGLDGHSNINYPRGLKQLIGLAG
jgi:exopolyphosphatase/guanosine-5'-triphosphate,3'-diphosphate pyrophosphatase